MKILVCGGRDFNDAQLLWDVMAEIFGGLPGDDMVIHGGARGADAIGGLWARQHGKMEVVVAAPWDYHGRSAGAIRNGWMLRLEPNLVVAFPGGKGTANMVEQARKAGVEVRVVDAS